MHSQRVLNDETGKAKRNFYFEKEVITQKEHLKGPLPMRPIKAVANSAIAYGHRKMFQVEDDNVSVKASHRGEMLFESAIRTVLRSRKTAPYSKVAKLEHDFTKKQANLAYRQALEKDQGQNSNTNSRMMQKRKIKKDYAKKAREAQQAAKQTKNAAKATGNTVKKGAEFVVKHPIVSLILLLLGLLLILTLSMCGVSGSLGGGGLGGVAISTYIAADVDMLGAEAAYSGMESDLQNYIDNFESTNSGYDEYRYDIDEIGHDPYVLISIISSIYDGEWTLKGVQSTLAMLFERQYILTKTVTVEVHYRTETAYITHPLTGEIFEVEYQVAYNYYICAVKLDNNYLSHLPVFIITT